MYFFGDKKKYSAWTRLNPSDDMVMIHAHESYRFRNRMILSRKILKFILKIFHCDFPLSSMNHIFSCKMSSPFNASINKMRN